jgi:CHAT domain-containing protein
VADASLEVERVTVALAEIDGQIRARSPRYAALTRPEPLATGDLQRLVLDENSLLLEYALGEERSYVWALTRTTFAAFELPKRADIEDAVRRVSGELTARQPRALESQATSRSRIRDADARYPADAAALSEMVLGPVGSLLGSRRLLVVADGALRYLPFGALPKPQSALSGGDEGTTRRASATVAEPLIIDHEVVHLPSASVLAALRNDVAGRPRASKALAVLADPVFDAADERVRQAGRRAAQDPAPEPVASAARPLARESDPIDATGQIARLPFTRREAESILALLSPEETLRALDFRASRATVTSDVLREFRVVHFATHAFLDDARPELTGLALSLVNERGESVDGFLRLHDLYDLEMRAELVVLSACQSALGKDATGEGLIGLARGLMYAGAPRVVASLWKVDDAATAELMKRFYAAMLGPQKLSPAAALRAAQIDLSKQRRWSAPYYWAAWVIQGEYRP